MLAHIIQHLTLHKMYFDSLPTSASLRPLCLGTCNTPSKDCCASLLVRRLPSCSMSPGFGDDPYLPAPLLVTSFSCSLVRRSLRVDSNSLSCVMFPSLKTFTIWSNSCCASSRPCSARFWAYFRRRSSASLNRHLEPVLLHISQG
jgi:hypothetical protein